MTYFHGDEEKKMADSKKLSFLTSPKAEQFLPKFYGMVLGIVGLIDAKGINVAVRHKHKEGLKLPFLCF